jgi:hypothetical protein
MTSQVTAQLPRKDSVPGNQSESGHQGAREKVESMRCSPLEGVGLSEQRAVWGRD